MTLHQLPLIKSATIENIIETDYLARKYFSFHGLFHTSLKILLSPLLTSFSRGSALNIVLLLYTVCRGEIIKRFPFSRFWHSWGQTELHTVILSKWFCFILKVLKAILTQHESSNQKIDHANIMANLVMYFRSSLILLAIISIIS